jgi:hypothetical protein
LTTYVSSTCCDWPTAKAYRRQRFSTLKWAITDLYITYPVAIDNEFAIWVTVSAAGSEAASDDRDVKSPETYIGYRQSENFASPDGIWNDVSRVYAARVPRLNEWSLSDDWKVGGEHAELNAKASSMVYRFHARRASGARAGVRRAADPVSCDNRRYSTQRKSRRRC